MKTRLFVFGAVYPFEFTFCKKIRGKKTFIGQRLKGILLRRDQISVILHAVYSKVTLNHTYMGELYTF